MAITLIGDFKIYQEEFNSGMYEKETQMIDLFNTASLGSLQLATTRKRGEYEKSSFFKKLSSTITRRDLTSTAAVPAIKMVQDEKVNVKLNKKFGPVDSTYEPFRMQGKEAESEFSFLLGQEFAQAKVANQVNTLISALVAGFTNIGLPLVYDGTASTPAHTGLVEIMSKMGDRSQDIVAWVMHSKSYFDLMKKAITDKVFEVAGVIINMGTMATLGKPVIVTDSPDLINVTPDPDEYSILGLQAGAAIAEDQDDGNMVLDVVTGLEQIVMRMQGEFNYNIGVKGLAWDIANGGSNPTDAAIATAGNWDQVVTSVKDCAGAMGNFQ